MSQFLLDNAAALRLAVFGFVLLTLAVIEVMAPRRQQSVGRLARWPNNLAVVLIDTLAVRLLIPVTLAGFAAYAGVRGWGLFNQLAVPEWLSLPGSILLLDLAIYAQHVAFHVVPLFWRLHRMHHADLEFDVTTGVRFHPLEIVLSVLFKLALILGLGPPAVAVLLFEIILNGMALFSHSNIALPGGLDAMLRTVVVTPDMHRVHHSVERAETDSNFGFNLSLWDRLFGTYRVEPAAGQLGMTIGIAQFREPGELRLDRLLTQPFRDDASKNLDRPS